MTNLLKAAALALTLSTQAATAGPIGFADWKTHWFASLFSRVEFDPAPSRMGVRADGSVSITYKIVPTAEQGATKASWRWDVLQSVPATDLRQKGGDDRNFALYFAFLPKEEAAQVGRQSLRKLLKNPNGRVLVYVHGGQHKRGSVLPSPYLGNRGKTVVLRPSGTGGHAESVDLAADYRRAFGTDPGALVALALSSDSDDTKTVARGQIADLVLN